MRSDHAAADHRAGTNHRMVQDDAVMHDRAVFHYDIAADEALAGDPGRRRDRAGESLSQLTGRLVMRIESARDSLQISHSAADAQHAISQLKCAGRSAAAV